MFWSKTPSPFLSKNYLYFNKLCYFDQNKESLNIKIIYPIQHKLHYYTHIEKVDLYYSLITFYKKNIQEFNLNGYKFIFRSKKGISYRKDGERYNSNFEYTIKLDSEGKNKIVKLKKLYIAFKPELENSFYGLSQKYGDHKPYTNKKGLGVEVEVNSTYFEFEETQNILKELIEYLTNTDFFKYQNKDKGLIRQCEYYIRYHEKKEKYIANTLNDLDKVIGLSIDEFTKITRNKFNNTYKLYSIRSNKFDELGFYNNNCTWRFGVKTYRLKEDVNLTKYSSIRNPKLEIHMDEQKKDEYLKLSYPKLIDFYKLKNSMLDIITHIRQWSKLKDKHIIGDNYFDPEKTIEFDFIKKTNLKDKLRELVQCIKPEIRKEVTQSNSVRDYLNHLIINDQVTYKSLEKSTGLGYDWIRKLTDKLEEKDIIQRIKSSINIIMFKNKFVADITKAIVSMLDFTFDNEPDREKRKIERKERRERRKKHIFNVWELKEKAITWLVENKHLPYRNGGDYEVRNYEIIYPENNIPGVGLG